MDLEFFFFLKWRVSGGLKNRYREKEKSLCDRSIDGADDEILLHPLLTFSNLKKCDTKEEKKEKGT